MVKKAVPKTTAIEEWEKSLALKAAKRMYVTAAVNLGWQLALAVLIPVIIGAWLDERYNTAPSYTLAALILAAIGAVFIVYKTVREATVKQTNLKGGKKHA